jgi:hypothetical protein
VKNAQSCNPWRTLVMLSAPAPAQPTVEAKPGQSPIPAVRLMYYNYARVPISVRIEGLQTTTRIFNSAGIQFTVCETQPDWNEPQSGQDLAPAVYLRTLPDAMANRLEPRFEAIGSPYSTDDNSGKIANVSYDRPQGSPISAFCSRGTILGHVIAHELGHLLLGRKNHSSGIMSANWQRASRRSAVQFRGG